MEVKELQEKSDKIIVEIDNKLRCDHDINNTFMHLIEEIGELSNELNNPNIRGKEIDKNELGLELADILFFISRIANLNGVDLEESIKNKINKLNERHDLNL